MNKAYYNTSNKFMLYEYYCIRFPMYIRHINLCCCFSVCLYFVYVYVYISSPFIKKKNIIIVDYITTVSSYCQEWVEYESEMTLEEKTVLLGVE